MNIVNGKSLLTVAGLLAACLATPHSAAYAATPKLPANCKHR